MQYVLMIHAAEQSFANAPKADVEAMMHAYGKYTHEIHATGRAGDSAPLQGTPTATSVQVRDGKRVVKDGPFADTREQLAGYYALDAKNEEEALDWASKIPAAAVGTIEVRPIVPTGDPITRPDAKGRQQYLILLYESEAGWASLSEAEQEAIFARYFSFSDGLKKNDQFIAGEQLDTVKKAKCVSVQGGKRVVKDGPFAETREQLGGYYRIFAANLDEAIALATKIPAVETGTVEIRPVMDASKYV